MSLSRLTVLFAGGGSAGHLLPAFATEEALRAISLTPPVDELKSVYLATAGGAELPLLREADAEFELVPKTDFPRKINRDLLTFIPRLTVAISRTSKLINRLNVDVVIGFGGYVALPAYCAARLTNTPLLIHEANALAGLGNRFGKRIAARSFSNFPIDNWGAESAIGLPIRKAISSIAKLSPEQRAELKRAARSDFGLDLERKTILIFGGSLGAAKINEVVGQSVDELLGRGFQILHAVGPDNSLPINRPGYQALPFISRMEQAYLAADIVLSRSGAGTCAEIEASGLPALLVPLPIGNGEQLLNAQALSRRGGVRIIENAALSRDNLITAITALTEEGFVSTSHQNSQSAAEVLAKSIFQLASQRKQRRSA
jgi:UDP-N-acetylglucosamine--N-acetylmuramyl-(pentapeptide) pyrophosphoryl-undecaprenol N-acetylglucosamine transferase